MGIFQADMVLKTLVELAFEDVRKNPWLVDDILSDAVSNPYLKDKYGQSQIDACKEWLRNNQVDITMGYLEKNKLPLIVIILGTSPEKEGMKTMADLSTESKILMPNEIGKPIPYVVKPFVPVGYDTTTGIVSLPQAVLDQDSIAEGMILVNPENGTGYIIQEIVPEGVRIEAGMTVDATQLAVVPQYQFYVARIEHSFFQETHTIECNAHGNGQVTMWMWAILKYALMRYREGLLEANGFTESLLNSGELAPNPRFSTEGGEIAWSRSITLTGQVENTWIKTPRRVIEKISLKELTPGEEPGFRGGIKILSNLDSPSFLDNNDQPWTTVDENEE